MRTYSEAGGSSLEEADDPSAAVAPLVDVSFLLLIFFLVTSTVVRPERDLNVGIPGPPEEGALTRAPMVIEIRGNGAVVLNPGAREMVLSQDASDQALGALKSQLAMMTAIGGNEGPLVVIRPLNDARQQRVVDVLNCLSGSGVQKVSFVDE
jgi:biopolymer transport protein ExbD